MTKLEFDDCKKVILDKLTTLKSEATSIKLNTSKLTALEKQVTDVIEEIRTKNNSNLDSQKL